MGLFSSYEDRKRQSGEAAKVKQKAERLHTAGKRSQKDAWKDLVSTCGGDEGRAKKAAREVGVDMKALRDELNK